MRHDARLMWTVFRGSFAGELPRLTDAPAMCTYDYEMAELGGIVFTRKYTLAGGGPCCDCHYRKKAGA